VEYVIATTKGVGPFNGEHISRLFDDAENGPVASRVTTESADAVVL
jgi:hypothetical protein